MTKLSYYFSAHKFSVLSIILFLNGILFLIAESAEIEMFGKVEALNHHWETYSSLKKDNMESRVIYSSLNDGEASTSAINYQYRYEASKDGNYIVLGYNEPSTIRHNRVYYLDQKCMLFFSGKSKMTLLNSAFRCMY